MVRVSHLPLRFLPFFCQNWLKMNGKEGTASLKERYPEYIGFALSEKH